MFKNDKIRPKILLLLIILITTLTSCSVYKTFVNVSRLKFKIASVKDFKLLGFPLQDKSSYNDFGLEDIFKLTTALARGKMPASFVVNLAAKNPNDGKGGFAPTDITIESFPWKLFINNKEILSGNFDKPIKVPGVGQIKIIPLRVQFDLLKIFKNKSVRDIVDIALSIGGAKASASHVKIIAKPVLGTPFGKITYPKPITIVSQKFN